MIPLLLVHERQTEFILQGLPFGIQQGPTLH